MKAEYGDSNFGVNGNDVAYSFVSFWTSSDRLIFDERGFQADATERLMFNGG